MSDDPLLSILAKEGHDLDIKEPVLDAEATIRKLRKAGVDMARIRLPSGILGKRRKLAEICLRKGISPVWCD